MSNIYEFSPFPKLARFNREIVVTEKIDGTNAQVCVAPIPYDYDPDSMANLGIFVRNGVLIRAGSRTRWIRPGKETDNYGFAAWVLANADELTKLGIGNHFGEWWGYGINRSYGLTERRFSLFNVGRWASTSQRYVHPGVVEIASQEATGPAFGKVGPSCCFVVPIIQRGLLGCFNIQRTLATLREYGSLAAPGYDNPEGIVIYHAASKELFKATCQNDDKRKSDLTTA